MPKHLTYVGDMRGIGRYAREGTELAACIRSRAELGARMARAIAPIGIDSPDPGEFRRSIHVEHHPVRGRHGLVVGYRIVADARDAVWAEIGRTRKRPYEGHRTLRTVAKALSTPRRRGRAA